MIGLAHISQYTGLPGWESQPEEEALMHYASLVSSKGVIVEIGVEFGMSSGAFAYANKDAKIYSIDLFPDNPTYGDMAVVHVGNLAEAGYVERITYLKGDSKEIGQEWTKPIDLLFVDGDHSYSGAYADLHFWTPHIVEGGYLLVHDSTPPTNLNPHPLHYEVQRAIEDWLKDGKGQWNELSPVDSMRVFQRKAVPAVKKEAETKAETKAQPKAATAKKAAVSKGRK